jgi:hypothetical protein
MLLRSPRGPLAAIYPLFSRRLQLPIPPGENLPLMPVDHVHRRDASDGAVRTDIVVVVQHGPPPLRPARAVPALLFGLFSSVPGHPRPRQPCMCGTIRTIIELVLYKPPFSCYRGSLLCAARPTTRRRAPQTPHERHLGVPVGDRCSQATHLQPIVHHSQTCQPQAARE